jgi:mono/diheme cytochrome c family protein
MLALIALPFSRAATKTPTDSASAKPKIDFNRDIRPIFSDTCYACHGPDANKRKAGLRLDQKEEAFKQAKSDNYAIVPGDLAKSKLIELITTEDKDEQMPPPESGKTLTKAQIDLLRQWVAEGAPWQNHWSYIPPERPALPPSKTKPGRGMKLITSPGSTGKGRTQTQPASGQDRWSVGRHWTSRVCRRRLKKLTPSSRIKFDGLRKVG